MNIGHSLMYIGVTGALLVTAVVVASPLSLLQPSNSGFDETSVIHDQHLGKNTSPIIQTGSVNVAEALPAKTHTIEMIADPMPNGQLGYRMISHEIDDGDSVTDVTSRYESDATVPGPTIVIDEGDAVALTINNNLGSGIVSVHVHGVHYDILSDGTLTLINQQLDQGATTSATYTYHWIAGPGTAGSWPYHDHTFGGINGAETRGLFGTVIVNPASGEVRGVVDGDDIEEIDISDIAKEFVFYVADDAFYAMEIDNNDDGQQTELGVNPTLEAEDGDIVRFHLIALGTDFHEFELEEYKWLDPGTNKLISSKEIGPLENHVFAIEVDDNSDYRDLQRSNLLSGMQGELEVS